MGDSGVYLHRVPTKKPKFLNVLTYETLLNEVWNKYFMSTNAGEKTLEQKV